jgi:hypothetical protein
MVLLPFSVLPILKDFKIFLSSFALTPVPSPAHGRGEKGTEERGVETWKKNTD